MTYAMGRGRGGLPGAQFPVFEVFRSVFRSVGLSQNILLRILEYFLTIILVGYSHNIDHYSHDYSDYSQLFPLWPCRLLARVSPRPKCRDVLLPCKHMQLD